VLPLPLPRVWIKGALVSDLLTNVGPTANLVLQSTIERIFAPLPDATEASPVKGYYADKTHGIFLVRGENVLLLGEIDLDKDDDLPSGYEEKDWKTVEKLAKDKKVADKAKEKSRLKKLSTLGFEGENVGETLL
jgi:U6 snRNA-associated Sm-like protein LSm1